MGKTNLKFHGGLFFDESTMRLKKETGKKLPTLKNKMPRAYQILQSLVLGSFAGIR